MTKELFNFDASLPPKANIPKFRDKLSSINDSVGPDAVITEEFIQQMVGLFGNVLDYIDLLEQDIYRWPEYGGPNFLKPI
ncbi:hypothetical protein EBR96_02955 [bacterium]|nr:hypothetical protein [bacterium]